MYINTCKYICLGDWISGFDLAYLKHVYKKWVRARKLVKFRF